jgi:beta-lactamase superfamily II metal-dependent hydrolase
MTSYGTMTRMWKSLVLIALALGASLGMVRAAGTLDIYFIDVEGGQATLIVTPAGESMLVDAGWPGYGGRDAARISQAARKAGIKRIDYMLVTHYHLDHVGGVTPLAERVPIAHFVDHGPNTETGAEAEELSAPYLKLVAKGRHIIVQPGDSIPLKGVEVKVLAARGERIASPLKGAGFANPLCQSEARKEPDPSENARSAGFLLTFGKFRFIDLGDLTWNKELELACPSNLVGTVDVYLTTHHGMDISGPRALVHSLRPRVAIMNNGAKKGGSPAAWRVVRASPGLEDVWQLHHAVAGGSETNSAADLIANPEEKCQGHGVKLSARSDGGFAVVNERTGFAKEYKAR